MIKVALPWSMLAGGKYPTFWYLMDGWTSLHSSSSSSVNLILAARNCSNFCSFDKLLSCSMEWINATVFFISPLTWFMNILSSGVNFKLFMTSWTFSQLLYPAGRSSFNLAKWSVYPPYKCYALLQLHSSNICCVQLSDQQQKHPNRHSSWWTRSWPFPAAPWLILFNSGGDYYHRPKLQHGIWLSIGRFHRRDPSQRDERNKL